MHDLLVILAGVACLAFGWILERLCEGLIPSCRPEDYHS